MISTRRSGDNIYNIHKPMALTDWNYIISAESYPETTVPIL
jgi:hypothetical protein